MNKSLFYGTSFAIITLSVLIVFFITREQTLTLNKQPLISVVVTSYNYEKFIDKTLKSILNQSYKNYEVVVIDDGSKDKSIDVIKKYTTKYKNFHLYTHDDNQNRGLIESVKLGVSKSSGDYVAFLESDDYWHKDNLLEKVKMINKYDDVFFISNGVEVFGESDSVAVRNAYIKRVKQLLFKDKNVIHPLQISTNFNPIPTFSCIMIKKEVLDNLDYNTTIPEFLDYWLYRQILLYNPLFHVKKKLTFWRQHGSSYNSIERFEKNLQNFDDFFNANNSVIFSDKLKLKKYTPF